MMNRKISVTLGLLAFLGFAAGCGSNLFEGMVDDQTPAAKQEAAKIALDNGDYPEAVKLLEGLCGTDLTGCDNDTKSDLASAYMGDAGLDVIKLIDAADSLVNQSTAQSDFTTFSQLLPAQTSENVKNMYNAVNVLSSIPSSQRTDDQNLQLATAAASSLILTVGALTGGFDPATGLPVRDLTADPITIADLNVPASTIGIPTTGSIGDTVLSTTTTIVEAGSAVLLTAVDSATDIDVATTEQITDMKTTMDTDGSSSISASELSAYINVNLIP